MASQNTMANSSSFDDITAEEVEQIFQESHLPKGPTFSPLTLPDTLPVCGPGIGCSWPYECRCGWQYLPECEVAQFRNGTAKWDPSTEFWTWTSNCGKNTHRLHFPSPVTSNEEAIATSAAKYLEEVDAWSRDVERLIAESKAIREAPLSAFASLAAEDDDDTIPEVDIEAA